MKSFMIQQKKEKKKALKLEGKVEWRRAVRKRSKGQPLENSKSWTFPPPSFAGKDFKKDFNLKGKKRKEKEN